MLTSKDDLSENNCPDCAIYLKERYELKDAFIEADVENILQRSQLKDEIANAYRLLDDAKDEINWLKAEHKSERSKQKAGVRKGYRASF
jgi:hypothetical protein